MINKKKTYYQDELAWILEAILVWTLMILAETAGIILAIFQIFRLNGFQMDVFGLTVFFCVIAPFGLFPLAHYFASFNIHINEKIIWMKGDFFLTKRWRVQYPVTVQLDDIVSIIIEKSSNNSKGQWVGSRITGLRWSKKTYLVFCLVSGKKRKMNVTHYTTPNLAMVIDDIVKRIGQSGNTVYDGKCAADILFVNRS